MPQQIIIQLESSILEAVMAALSYQGTIKDKTNRDNQDEEDDQKTTNRNKQGDREENE